MKAAAMLDKGNEETILPENYQLQPYDVICGRHKFAFNNVGNRRFRVTISTYVQEFLDTSRRQDRTFLFMRIVAVIRQSGGRFLKFENGRWVDVGNLEARRKVGHALRDIIRAKGLPIRDKREASVRSETDSDSKEETSQVKRRKTVNPIDLDLKPESYKLQPSVMTPTANDPQRLPDLFGPIGHRRLQADRISSMEVPREAWPLQTSLQTDLLYDSESSVESIDSLTPPTKKGWIVDQDLKYPYDSDKPSKP